MTATCAIADGQGVVRSMLASVDCNTRGFARAGYEALTGHASFQAALTLLLTIYVAAIGYRLLFAPEGARLADGPLAALKIGAVLALVTNWSLFETLVFDTAARAPLEIAALATVPLAEGSALAADPVGGLQTAYDELWQDAGYYAKPAKPGEAGHGGGAQSLTVAADAVFLVGGGLVAAATIAVGVLTALGPLFIAAFLFFPARGLLIGWLRAMAATGFAILSSWVLNLLMLVVLEPWLLELGQARQLQAPPDDQLAMTASAIVFVFAASQVALVLLGAMIARGLALRSPGRSGMEQPRPIRETASAPLPLEMVSRAARLSERLQPATSEAATPRLALSAATARRAPSGHPVSGETASLYRRPQVTRLGARGDGP